MNNIVPVAPFPSLIYKTHFDGDLSLVEDIALRACQDEGIDYILESGGKSTYNVIKDAILKPECAELHNFIIKSHNQVWDQWHLTDRPRYLHSSWFNWHPPGAQTDEHDHSGVHLVVVAYIKNPVNGGNIQFKDPMQQIWASFPRKEEFSYDWKTVEVKTGDVLFFPGFLRHRSEKNMSNEDRLVITANVCVDLFG